jgi:hypothetical protein
MSFIIISTQEYVTEQFQNIESSSSTFKNIEENNIKMLIHHDVPSERAFSSTDDEERISVKGGNLLSISLHFDEEVIPRFPFQSW